MEPHLPCLLDFLQLGSHGGVLGGGPPTRASQCGLLLVGFGVQDVENNNLTLVPYSLVDSVIEESARAHDEAAGGDSYSIYLLNLKPQPLPYAYSFQTSPDKGGVGGGNALGSSCPGTSFQRKVRAHSERQTLDLKFTSYHIPKLASFAYSSLFLFFLAEVPVGGPERSPSAVWGAPRAQR